MSEIIKFLTSEKGFQIKCPNCGEIIEAKKSNLFDIRENYPPKIKTIISSMINKQNQTTRSLEKNVLKLNSQLKDMNSEKSIIKNKIKSKPKRIKTITKHVNIGQIIEKILPGSKSFRYDVKDCRAIFDPIDYISFNGLTKDKEVESITIIEIKSGDASLQRNQKNIKKQIENGKIKYLEYWNGLQDHYWFL